MHPKVKNQKTLRDILRRHKKNGKRIVFTNGCFDLLHPGHVAYLNKAKQAGDILVVGLNSDRSVKMLKGRGRPLLPAVRRATVLAGLACVDYITVFDEVTPLQLIAFLRPDVLVKGGDWKKKAIVGRDVVESYGGCVKRIPYLKGYSTTRLIKRICRMFS